MNEEENLNEKKYNPIRLLSITILLVACILGVCFIYNGMVKTPNENEIYQTQQIEAESAIEQENLETKNEKTKNQEAEYRDIKVNEYIGYLTYSRAKNIGYFLIIMFAVYLNYKIDKKFF